MKLSKKILAALLAVLLLVKSFVSYKNTNIKSVQFVIRTDAIKVKEVEVIELGNEDKLNFSQKLLALFGY